MAKAVRRAAHERKVVHFWAHPWDFRTEQDFDKLKFLLDHVAQHVDSGTLRSVGMSELAEIVLNTAGKSSHVAQVTS
jgi:hypothetical protein